MRNRETWFAKRVTEVRDQIIKNKELYIPPPISKRESDRKRAESFHIKDTPKQHRNRGRVQSVKRQSNKSMNAFLWLVLIMFRLFLSCFEA